MIESSAAISDVSVSHPPTQSQSPFTRSIEECRRRRQSLFRRRRRCQIDFERTMRDLRRLHRSIVSKYLLSVRLEDNIDDSPNAAAFVSRMGHIASQNCRFRAVDGILKAQVAVTILMSNVQVLRRTGCVGVQPLIECYEEMIRVIQIWFQC